MKMWRSWLQALVDCLSLRLLTPERCVVCGRQLSPDEHSFCGHCLLRAPMLDYGGEVGNTIERLFWGLLPVECAATMFSYSGGSGSTQMITFMKYSHRPLVGYDLARLFARQLKPKGFFEGIDVIVPVPLSRERTVDRGYNQSEHIARGLAAETGLAVVADGVRRIKDNPTQTRLARSERIDNVAGIFRLVRPDRLHGRHVLLVDDVVTSGATLVSLGREVLKAGDVRISILTLSAGTTAARMPYYESEDVEADDDALYLK